MVIPQDMPVMEMAIVAAHALVIKLMNNEHVSVLFSKFRNLRNDHTYNVAPMHAAKIAWLAAQIVAKCILYPSIRFMTPDFLCS
jgi:hypothetical protein